MSPRASAALAFVTALSAAGGRAQATASACLRYEPDTVALSGVLRRETHPGPPNYESVRAGDAPETGFYLHLALPVCARGRPVGDGEPDPTAAPVDSAHVVQLVLDRAGYARLRPSLGREVTLRGTLFSAYTGHHHAPLLLTPLASTRAGSAR